MQIFGIYVVLTLLLGAISLGHTPGSLAASDPFAGLGQSEADADSPIEPVPIPDGWKKCFEHRVKVAYVEGLPWYQRAFALPYGALEKWRYVRCSKAQMPSTREFMETHYPLPYDPASQLKPANRDIVSPPDADTLGVQSSPAPATPSVQNP
jgi:hypothetical protein